VPFCPVLLLHNSLLILYCYFNVQMSDDGDGGDDDDDENLAQKLDIFLTKNA